MPRNIVRRRSETVSKQCLRLVFHEKHIFELCFEKEEKESVQKEEFWSRSVSEHYLDKPSIVIMIDKYHVLLRTAIRTSWKTVCFAKNSTLLVTLLQSNAASPKSRQSLEMTYNLVSSARKREVVHCCTFFVYPWSFSQKTLHASSYSPVLKVGTTNNVTVKKRTRLFLCETNGVSTCVEPCSK